MLRPPGWPGQDIQGHPLLWRSLLDANREWPGPQDDLGQRGLRLKWAKGRFWSNIVEKNGSSQNGLPTAENLSGLQESIFSLFRSPQLHFGEKFKNCRI